MNEALAELATATGELEKASELEREASRHETTARNRVNAAQKRVDALLAEMKKAAAWNTEWKQREMTRVERP